MRALYIPVITLVVIIKILLITTRQAFLNVVHRLFLPHFYVLNSEFVMYFLFFDEGCLCQ